MNHTEREVEEVDQLVRTLTSTRASSVDPTVPGGERRQVSRWTNVTMRMPSRREPGITRRFGNRVATEFNETLDDLELWLRQAITYVRNLRRFIRMPSAITLVRLWVALAAACGAAMAFWPYPKTYFWGIVLYQSCLALSLVAGVWGARLSWDARLGAAHTLALGTVLWAVTLGATDTVALLHAAGQHEAPTFASARFSPQPRPAMPVKAPAKSTRTKTTVSPT